MNDLELARLKRDRERLKNAEQWSPQEALEACLSDLKLGELANVECVVVLVSRKGVGSDEAYSFNERYVGTNGATGPKETYWVFGLIGQALHDWFAS